jgi:hypothetical protein
MMPLNKKNKDGGDPRVNAFAETVGSSLFEHFSTQVGGEVVSKSGDIITVKKGKDEMSFITGTGDRMSVHKITISKDGEKSPEESSIEEVKKGAYIKANLIMLPSGDWEATGISIREIKE